MSLRGHIRRADRAILDRLYPFRSRSLSINGFRYHYLDEGSGDPIIMVHGNPTWSFYFRRLVAALRDRYRVIVPDHIGCGLSEAPALDQYGYTLDNRVDDLAALIDALELGDRLTLVGHDWGGMIGTAYAAEHPERFSRLILMNTAAFFPPGGKGLPLRLFLVRNLNALSAPAVLGLNLFAVGAAWMAPARPLPADVRRGLLAPYRTPRRRLATLRFVQDIPVRPTDPAYPAVARTERHIHRLSGLPALLLWGARDFVFDLDYLAEWQRRLPAAESHVFSDAGHYILEDAGGEIIRKVQDFLKNHPI